MIMVTHEMKFAREVSTQVVYLHQGVIEEQATPQEIFDSPRSERLKAFLGMPDQLNASVVNVDQFKRLAN